MHRPCPPRCPNARSRIADANAGRFSAVFYRRKANGALPHGQSAVSHGNDFALLDKLGGDVAGALQILPPEAAPTTPDRAPTPRLLDDAGLIRVLDALPTRPLLAGEEGMRLSLAGSQSKVPVVLVEGAVALPSSGQPTTHILKPSIARFPGTTENEAFVMRLAAAAGLDVAPVEPRAITDRKFLLVERYDRSSDAARPGSPYPSGRLLPSPRHQPGTQVCRRRRPDLQELLRAAPSGLRAAGGGGPEAARRRDLQSACRQRRCPRQELFDSL